MASVREYLAEFGRPGGANCRRTLDPKTARDMVRVRGARRVCDPVGGWLLHPVDLAIDRTSTDSAYRRLVMQATGDE